MKLFQLGLMMILVFSVSAEIMAQSNGGTSSNNHQLWLDMKLHYKKNAKLEYFGDGGYRVYLNDQITTRLYVRPSAKYYLGEIWQIQGGLGLFFSDNASTSNILEVRPWQGVQVSWPRLSRFESLTWLKFKHLVRLEQQISFETGTGSSDFNFRFRYKPSATINLCKECGESYWYIPVYFEFFVPIKNEISGFFSNRTRIGVGIGFHQSKVWSYNFGLNWHRSRSDREDDFKVSDYVYRITVVRNIQPK